MKRMHIWVVEAQHVSKPGSRWTPVLFSPLGRGAHATRFMARITAKRIQDTNMWNKHKLTVRYRVRKYQAT